MSEFKGTEGKWIVKTGKVSGFVVESDSAPKSRKNIAACGGQRREENANLIAAAPELLEVLTITGDEIGHWLSQQKPELKEKIDAAIAKALGDKS